MAQKFIGKGIKRPSSFTAQAKKRGMSPTEFQQAILSSPKSYNPTIVKRAKLRKKFVNGGEIEQEEYSLGGILGSVGAGAGTGALFGAGPIGGIIGGIVGLGAGIAGHIGEKRAEKDQMNQFNEQRDLILANQQEAKQDSYLAQLGSNQAVNPFTPTFPYGGLIPYQQGGLVGAEVEDDEVLQRPNGNIRKVDGAKHAQGGIDVNEPAGTRVYSDREIYKPTGKTFAQEAESIMKRLAQLDKQLG